jgi:hypothetical protein
MKLMPNPFIDINQLENVNQRYRNRNARILNTILQGFGIRLPLCFDLSDDSSNTSGIAKHTNRL